MNFHGRGRVLWVAQDTLSDELRKEFEHREMEIITSGVRQVSEELYFAKAIVDFYDADCKKRVEKLLTDLQPFDHGLLYIIIIPERLYNSVEREFSGFRRTGHGRLVTITDRYLYKIAQSVANHDPGPPANMGVLVTGCPDKEVELLLRRAFFDSVSVNLIELQGGNASKTFRAEVVLGNADSPVPLPYFVKYDTKIERIKREQDNYRGYVEQYVPFNHRPNLVHERCIVGQRFGLIVGDLVENSEPLGQVAIRGVVHSAVHSLFQSALRGWRRQAFHYSLDPSHSIFESLTIGSKLLLYAEPAEEVQLCAAEVGATSTFHDLDGMLRSFPPVKHLQGPIHRDLHINNVHVHGTDAILLDFYATSPSGPLLYDAALLEVSLVFEAWKEQENQSIEWIDVVKQLYSTTTLQFPLIPPMNNCPCPGIVEAVQEVRLYANSLEIDKGSYKQALVIALLRIASPTMDVKTLRKAHAILIAEQLSKAIIGGEENV